MSTLRFSLSIRLFSLQPYCSLKSTAVISRRPPRSRPLSAWTWFLCWLTRAEGRWCFISVFLCVLCVSPGYRVTSLGKSKQSLWLKSGLHMLRLIKQQICPSGLALATSSVCGWKCFLLPTSLCGHRTDVGLVDLEKLPPGLWHRKRRGLPRTGTCARSLISAWWRLVGFHDRKWAMKMSSSTLSQVCVCVSVCVSLFLVLRKSLMFSAVLVSNLLLSKSTCH